MKKFFKNVDWNSILAFSFPYCIGMIVATFDSIRNQWWWTVALLAPAYILFDYWHNKTFLNKNKIGEFIMSLTKGMKEYLENETRKVQSISVDVEVDSNLESWPVSLKIKDQPHEQEKGE